MNTYEMIILLHGEGGSLETKSKKEKGGVSRNGAYMERHARKKEETQRENTVINGIAKRQSS